MVSGLFPFYVTNVMEVPQFVSFTGALITKRYIKIWELVSSNLALDGQLLLLSVLPDSKYTAP